MRRLLASLFLTTLLTGHVYSDDYGWLRSKISPIEHKQTYDKKDSEFVKYLNGYTSKGVEFFDSYDIKSDDNNTLAVAETKDSEALLLDSKSTDEPVDTIYVEANGLKRLLKYDSENNRWLYATDNNISRGGQTDFVFFGFPIEKTKEFDEFVKYCGDALRKAHENAKTNFAGKIRNHKYANPVSFDIDLVNLLIRDDTNIDVDKFLPEYQAFLRAITKRDVYKTGYMAGSETKRDVIIEGRDTYSDFKFIRNYGTIFLNYIDGQMRIFIGDALGNETPLDTMIFQTNKNKVIFVNKKGKWFVASGDEINDKGFVTIVNGTYVRETDKFKAFVNEAAESLKKAHDSAKEALIEEINKSSSSL